VRVLLPGHGPLVSDPSSTLAYYIEHRAERLAEVRAALAAGDTTAQEIVARVYHDVDPGVRRFAELSVQAQLDYLAARGERDPRLPGRADRRTRGYRPRGEGRAARVSANGRVCAGARRR
jgi:hypothetical protein